MLVGIIGFTFASVGAAAAVFAAFFWNDIVRLAGHFTPSELLHPDRVYKSNVNVKKCEYLDRTLFGCESGSVVGDLVYLACSHKLSRLRWYPALYNFEAFKMLEPDSVYVYNFKDKKLRLLSLERIDTGMDMVFSGLSAAAESPNGSKNVVSMINHRRKGTCVEIFTHDVIANSLVRQESVCDDLLTGATGIALLDAAGSFFVSVPHHEEKISPSYHHFTPLHLFGGLFGRSTSGLLLHRRGGKDAAGPRVVRRGLSYPVDVAITAGKNALYLLLGGTGTAEVYDITSKKDGKVRVSNTLKTIQLPHLAKRLHVPSQSHDENGLYTVGVAKGTDVALWAGFGFSHTVPSVVISMRNNTADDSRFYGQPYLFERLVVDIDSRYFQMATLVASYLSENGKRTLIVGGPLMQGVVRCVI